MRALILAAALLLAPAAGWAQSTWSFHPGAPAYGPDGSLLRGITADALNAASTSKADFPLSTVAVPVGHNPLPLGSPLYNWGRGVPSNVPGGVADPLGLYINNGGLYATKPYTWGTEDRACGISIIMNITPDAGTPPGDNNHCEVLGTLAYDPSRVSATTSRDSVALYAQNEGGTPVSIDPAGTYDATHYYPSAGYVLTATQVAELRVGMFIDVGASIYSTSKWTGTITGWAADGSSITVSNWYQFGSGGVASTPTNGLMATVNPITNIWAANFATEVDPTGAQNSEAIELDVVNNSTQPIISGDPYYRWGIQINGGGTYGGGSAVIAQGKWLTPFSSQAGSYAGFIDGPPSSVNQQYGFDATGSIQVADFHASASGGLAYDATNSGGRTFSVDHAGNIVASGTFTLTGGARAAFFDTADGGIQIGAAGAATFSGNIDVGSLMTTGAINVGGVSTNSISISGGAYLPTGTAPSGTCSVAGQLMGDAVKLYWCPSAGGVWKAVALTTN